MTTIYNKNGIHVAPAIVYIGGTAPADNIANSITGGVPASGGTNVGMTDGVTEFKLVTTKHPINGEQALGDVDVVITKQTPQVTFTMKEATFGKLSAILQGSTTTNDTASTPKAQKTFGGGVLTIPQPLLTLVSAKRVGVTTLYYIITLYKAYFDSDLVIPFSKEGESMVKITMTGLFDVSRAAGDQAYQIVEQYDTTSNPA